MIKGISTSSKSTPTSPVTPKLPPPIPSSCLSAKQPSKIAPTLQQASAPPNKSQFRHTILWNNILSNLRQTLIENNNTSRLRKQHSRFASGMVGGMLLIKQNWRNTTTTTNLSSETNKYDNIYFNGSQCVDIVYNYLTSSNQTYKFERKVTRDKVTKLCQMIMDSGVFEPISRSSSRRFDDTSLKYYRFKQDYLNDLIKAEEQEKSAKIEEKCKEDKATVKDEIVPKAPIKKECKEDKENHNNNQLTPVKRQNENEENQPPQQSQKSSLSSTYNKAIKSCQNLKTSNTKLKRKLTSMRRSTTMQTLLQLQDSNNQNTTSTSTSNQDSTKQKESVLKDIKNFKELHPLSPNTSINQTIKTPYSTSNFNLNDLKYVCTEKSDVKFNIETNKTFKSSTASIACVNTNNSSNLNSKNFYLIYLVQ
jgi:hypothetical protein